MKLLRNLLPSLLSIFLFLNGFGHSLERVVCIGEDGHFEIEHAVNGQCGSLERSHHECKYEIDLPHMHLAESDSHCGDCSDYPLLRSESVPVSPGNGLINSFFTLHKLANISTDRAIITKPVENYRHNSAPPLDPDYRRTVVLLI